MYYYYLLLLYLSSMVPKVDFFISSKIASLKSYKFSKYFSIYIIYFNIFANIYYYYVYRNYTDLLIRYFIELIIINVFFKMLINRPRPYESINKNKNNKLLNKNNNYVSLFQMTMFDNYFGHDSFPSGHVATVYGTYLLFNSYFYLFLVFLTIYSRINIRMHYFSDCLCAILITDLFKFIFKFGKIIFYHV